MLGLSDQNQETLLDYLVNCKQDLPSDCRTSILITFQSTNMTGKTPKNLTNCNSYNWLISKIGYMPIFTIKIKLNKLKDRNYLKKTFGSVMVSGTKYVYILNPQKLKCIDTDMYRWVDVHFIENEGPESEDDDRIKKMYDKDWKYITKLDNYGPVQTLIPKITKESVIKMFKF